MNSREHDLADDERAARLLSEQLQGLVWLTLEQTPAVFEGEQVPWSKCPHVLLDGLCGVLFQLAAALVQRDAAVELPRVAHFVEVLRSRVLALNALSNPSSEVRH